MGEEKIKELFSKNLGLASQLANNPAFELRLIISFFSDSLLIGIAINAPFPSF